MTILLPVLLGALFGLALFYANSSNPDRVLQMLQLKDLSLLKTILFAIGFSNVLLYAAHQLSVFDISHLSIKETNLSVILGGMLFGLGFGLVGSCPGGSLAALTGGFFRKAIGIVVGGLFGALAFSFTFELLDNYGFFKIMNWGDITWFKLTPSSPSVFELGFTGLLISGLLLMIIAVIMPSKNRN